MYISKPRSSINLERKAPAFFATFKLMEFSKYDSNMVCTSQKKQKISRVSRVWLKNYACHTLLKFEIVLAGNPFFSQARDTKFGGKLKTYEYNNW